MLEACKEIRNKFKFKLIIAGPVSHEFQQTFYLYEQLNLGELVHFLPAVDNKMKRKLLDQADLFVIPSRELETFGLTAIEAMSSGVPVIGTPVGAIPEILKKVDKRLICKDVNSKALARKILWFYCLSEKEKLLLRKKSVSLVSSEYVAKKYEDQILKLYCRM